MEIKGSVVFVTGASSGIGAATARAASRAGARVVLAARRENRLLQLATELDGAIAVRCNVTDPSQVREAVGKAMDTFGRIDVLVNNAGQGLQASIEDIDPKEFRDILELNIIAPLTVMQTVIPIMRQQGAGSIINMSSGVVFSSLPETGAYAASKAGIAKLSAVARAELADAGIVVSTMLPFVTSTEFIQSMKAGQEAAARLESSNAPEPQKPEQVAEAILDLIRSGAEQADLVPEKFGGTFKG